MYTENTRNGSVRILRIHGMYENLNISASSKQISKIFQDVYQEPRWVRLAKSLKTKKSHASVPLTYVVCILMISEIQKINSDF